jgi:hypothetical protein
MSYNPVPLVVTGDAWTAANHNIYIRDNFAAGVPAIFTAKGDLAVGSAAQTAVALPVGSNRKFLMALDSETSGLVYDNPYFVSTDSMRNDGYMGDTINVGTYTIVAHDFNSLIPVTAKAINVSISAQWTSANSGYYCRMIKPTCNGNGILVRSMVANYFNDNSGIVGLDDSGQFSIVVAGASCVVYIDIYGYFI